MFRLSGVGGLLAGVTYALASSEGISPYALQGVVDAARLASAATPLTAASNLANEDYLKLIHGVVTWFLPYQNKTTGSIIDPFAHQEIQYATPCFAFSAAVLVDSGFDQTLLEPASFALDSALAQLSNGTCASGHNNFFTFPAYSAYALLKAHAPAARVSQWEFYLGNINPAHYVNIGMNWGLVAAGGEFARVVLGGFGQNSYNSTTWWSDVLARQIQEEQITPTGNYQDHSGTAGLNPLPYDTFPLKYLAVMLAEGYGAGNYTYSSFLTDVIDRAAWTHALQLSPRGEVMTGGRSSQHSWNEAASAVIFEIYAKNYAAAGDMKAACIFRRSARMALRSLTRWQTEEGRLQIVKNWFDPSLRYGYEEYSYLSQYNLLPAAQMAAAYGYAVQGDALPTGPIPECAAFADVGGFVFALPELNVVAANAGGTYIELETGSDPNYDATGLMRMHVSSCGTKAAGACTDMYSLLGPSAPAQRNFWGTPQPGVAAIASAGVWWRSSDNASVLHRLGDQMAPEVTAAVLSPYWNNSQSSVSFSMDYVLLGAGVLVTENYSVTDTGLVGVSAAVQLYSGAGGRAALRAWLESLWAVAQVDAGAARLAARLAAEDAGEASSVTPLLSLPAGRRTPPPVPVKAAGASTITAFGVSFLALLSDGVNTTSVGVDTTARTVTVALPAGNGQKQTFAVAAPPAAHGYTWAYDPNSPTPQLTRNGHAMLVDVALTGFPAGSMRESIEYSLQAAGSA